MAESKEIVVVAPKDYKLMTAASQLGEIFRENVGGQLSEFNLDRVKVPAGGGTMWEVPGLEGISNEKTLDGTIVYNTSPRAYWKQNFDESGGGTPPECSSKDGTYGIGEPGGECATCPLAKFGSAPLKKGQKESRGQACKQMRQLFMVRPNSLIPVLVTAPPTSLGEIQKYFLRLAGEAVPYWAVVTSLSLEKDKNKDGTVYSKIVPKMLKRLSEAEMKTVKEYASGLKSAFQTVTVDRADVAE